MVNTPPPYLSSDRYMYLSYLSWHTVRSGINTRPCGRNQQEGEQHQRGQRWAQSANKFRKSQICKFADQFCFYLRTFHIFGNLQISDLWTMIFMWFADLWFVSLASKSTLKMWFVQKQNISAERLKGLSHEIDFKNVDAKWQILALIRVAAGFWIFQTYLWFFVEIKPLLSGKC